MNKNPTYKIYQDGNKVIAVSTFAGKPVKGYAKCHPNDAFDFEYGKNLATLRCAAKIATKRWKRACSKVNIAERELTEATAFFEDMSVYENRSKNELNEAEFALALYLAK